MPTVTLRAIDIPSLKAEIRSLEQQIRAFKNGTRASRRGNLSAAQLRSWNRDMPFCQSELAKLKSHITLLHEARAAVRGKFHQRDLHRVAFFYGPAVARQRQADQVASILECFTMPVLVMQDAVQSTGRFIPVN